ncbi:MAG TPA: DUF6352 family protein [Usitatibacter sp.]|nr:DUF6352 family protein [Usitatibacter sp.]
MAQDFWASSGYRLLERGPGGLRATDAWLATFTGREELHPPAEAGPRERALHARLAAQPRATVREAELAALEDADARENWREFLRFRARVLSHATLEDCYRALFADGVDVAPVFVDALARAIARAMLEGTEDAWLCRAAEFLFRRQRVAAESGRLLAADAATIEAYAQTGGFGSVGRLLRSQGTSTAAVKMDVLTRENAPFYFLRDELYGFVLDITSGGEGAAALARVLERWIARLAGVAVTIEPVERVEDARWRWHVGLDADSTAILNALYRGEAVPAEDLERLLLLFRLEFRDAADADPALAGRPVYLGLACRPDRTLRMKPQNLLANLPLSPAAPTARG